LFSVLPRAKVEEDTSVPTDLARLVDACRDAAKLTGIATPPSPWLEALPTHMDIDQLFHEFPRTQVMVKDLKAPYGMTDLPSQQLRGLACFDVAASVNLAVAGAGRSGRSTLLRTIAAVIAKNMSPTDVHLYAIDAGGNALLPLERLPHTGAVVLRDQAERITRLARLLRSIIASRQQQLATQGYANLHEQRAGDPTHRLPYIVLLLDAWDVFYQTYESLDGGSLPQAIQQILQEGPGVGISAIVTGDRSLMIGRTANLFPEKLMLRVTDPADYSYIGMSLRHAPASVAQGRCFSSLGLIETQVALIDVDPAGTAQVAALQAIAREATTKWVNMPANQKPRRVDVMPIRYNMSDINKLPHAQQGPHLLPVAVGGDTLSVYGLDTSEHGPGFLITGPRRTGRSTTLKTMALFALSKGWKVMAITMRASALATLTPNPLLIGPYDGNNNQQEITDTLQQLRNEPNPSLVIVDDIERVPNDGWLTTALERHLDAIRDTGSALAGAGTPSDMGGYRGICAVLKKAHSGVMLSPQAMNDCEMFGTTLPRSAFGQTLPPGGGYLIQTGANLRAQVINPDVPPA